MAPLVAFISGVASLRLWQYFPRLTIILLAALTAYILLLRRERFLVVPFLVAGLLYAGARSNPSEIPALREGGNLVVTGSASPALETPEGYFKQSIYVVDARDAASGVDVPIEELRVRSRYPLKCGPSCSLLVKAYPLKSRQNPGSSGAMPTSGEVVRVLGEMPAGFIGSARGRLSGFLAGNFPKREAGFIMALTTGERSHLDPDVRKTFNYSGVGHLLSISGTHFGIFSLLVFLILRGLFRLLPMKALERLTLCISPSQAGALLSLPVLVLYLLLSGAQIPAVRSFIMIGLFLVGLLIGRRKAWLGAIVFAAFVIVLWQPASVYDVSFQLSFLAVFFIGLFTERFRERRGSNPVRKYLIGGFLISIAASAGLLPVTAYYFHRVSLVSPIANFLLVPLAGFVLLPLYLFSSLSYLAFGHFPFAALAAKLTSMFFGLVGAFASVPYGSVPVAAFPLVLVFAFYAPVVLFLLTGRRSLLALAVAPVLIAVLTAALRKPAVEITFLDSGGGESSVIGLPDGKVFVLDAGKSGYETASYLSYRGIEGIDVLILSHPHSDHAGGAAHLAGRFRIGEIWEQGGQTAYSGLLDGIPKKSPKRGDYIEGDGYRLTVLHPYEGFSTLRGSEYLAQNNLSLVMKLEDAHGQSVLLPGDAGREAEEDMLHLGGVLKSSVLKMPHHGSRHSVHPGFIGAVSPEVVVIMAEKGNPFGHPHAEALEAVAGREILSTDTDGAVTVRLRNGLIETRTFAETAMKRHPSSAAAELHNLGMLFSVQ